MTKVNKTYNIEESIVKMVDKYSEQSGIFKSKIVEFALKEYLEKKYVYEGTKLV